MKKLVWSVLPIITALAFWECVSRSGAVNSALFPPPSLIGKALGQMVQTSLFWSDIGVSSWRLFIGLGLGVLTGVTAGLLTGRIKIIAAMLYPIIQILRPLPPVAIIPLVIVWFGIDDGAKIFSIAFAAFFPVWINTHIGSQEIPKVYLWSARLLSGSWTKIFLQVIFPFALGFIVAGVRTAIALAFIMVFVSELAGASKGLGYRISISHLSYRIDEMIATLAVLGILGALADRLFVASVGRLFPWIRIKTI